MTLDERLTWSKHTDQVRKKAVQRLEPLLNRRSGLSIKPSQDKGLTGGGGRDLRVDVPLSVSHSCV